jgi:ABC-2 type transport system ATP-binding protein
VRAPNQAPTAGPVVEAVDLRRSFGDTLAVAGVSFRIERGEMFGIIGPDGAGKTTTLRLVLGLLAPHGGNVATCGFDPARQRMELSSRIGYLSQRFSLYGDLSVDENVAFFAEVHGVRGWKPRRDEMLAMLRLAEFRGRLADRLSGGMRQKLALACTLMHTPELLVLDEPTTGVDPVSRREFWRILGRLQRDGLTILVTTPYLDEAERCERVALMDQGRILETATPELLRGMERQRMVELIARPRRLALEWLRARPEVAEVETFGERLHLSLRETREDAGGVAQQLAAGLRASGVEVDSAREIPPSLEDVFIARIRRGSGEPQRTMS